MKDLVGHVLGLDQIGVYRAPDHGNVRPFRIPDGVEIVEVLTGGEVFFQVAGIWHAFGKGTIFWHQSGDRTIWRTTADAPYRCTVFRFPVSRANRAAPRVSAWNSDTDLEAFLSECLRLFHAHRLDPDVLALYTYSSLLRSAAAQDSPALGDGHPKALSRALAYIHDNLAMKLPVEHLARHSRISASHLFKLFRTHLGTTPHQYILSQQLAQARAALIGSSESIKEIALDCGFRNLEVFYRCFHRESGMPPGEYRRKHSPYRL